MMKSALKDRGFTIFLDMDDLPQGDFDKEIMERLLDTPVLLVMMSKGFLERCVNQDDWVRREIAAALKANKIIIPISEPSFVFPAPEDLPEDIRGLLTKNAVSVSHEFFEAFINKVVRFMEYGPSHA
eukprot:TRINITY_DN3260_c0_g1_i1.p1 TRINITY_DN3260_c0_g1~~TRINITY_DN3260_c0_g1_i1.p1  ORF type:complete len:127 (+),score=37.76 TRINITY_DN3260_c0_g1_i1:113-493(+)